MTTLPSGWAQATVGEIAELADGPFGSNLKTAHYTEAGPRVVRLQNIGDGIFRDERAHIAQGHYERLIKHAVRPGDIVAASLGENAPRACLVPSWLGPAIVKADCIRVRTFGGVDPAFLMWMLNSRPVHKQAASSIKGVGRPRLGLGGLSRLTVPIPPPNEARRIVAAIEEQFSRLDAAEAAIRTARRRLDRMSAAILSAAFREVRETRRLADLAEVRLGRQRSPKNHSGPNMRPYLRAANVTWAGLDLADVKSMNFSPSEVSTYELVEGDVLLSEASGSADEVGKPAIWHGEIPGCCFQNTLIRVRARDALPEYLHKVFLRDALTGKFAQAAPGVGIHHLGSTRLSAWPIPIAPLDQQGRIVADVERQLSIAEAMTAEVDRAIRRSAALRRLILELAFTGQLAPQDPSDEPASMLLERIAAERAAAPKPSRRKRKIPA